MKVIVAGSREYNNYDQLKRRVTDFVKIQNLKPWQVEVVSGGARGADRLGEKLAKEFGYNLKLFPADWDKYGKSAGYLRNKQMAEYADTLFAFWDGESRGTKHMIELAKTNNIEYYVTIYK